MRVRGAGRISLSLLTNFDYAHWAPAERFVAAVNSWGQSWPQECGKNPDDLAGSVGL